MSVSFGCHCGEREKPVRERNWRVIRRWESCSAFNGYRVLPSDYSQVVCLTCRATGRTKAMYVHNLADYDFTNQPESIGDGVSN